MTKNWIKSFAFCGMLLFVPIAISQTVICRPVYAAEYNDAETVMSVQDALNSEGYDCGTADGLAGSQTMGAIQQYQQDKGLTVSGSIDDELLKSLGLLADDLSGDNITENLPDYDSENEAEYIDEAPISASGTFEYEILTDGTAMITKYDGDSDLIIPEEIDGYVVSEIEERAFDYDSFDSVVIPASVQKIGEKAFYHASIKSELTIPGNIVIEADAFRGAELPDIFVISSGTTIGENAFAYSSGIKNLSILEDVTVGEKAFYYAEDLDSVIISTGVIIDDDAFRDSEIQNLTEIEDYDSSLTTQIGETAFAYCKELKNVVLPTNTILDKKAFYYAKISESLIFEGITEIGEDAFRDAELPEDLAIPANSTVGETAFAYTEGIKNLSIGENVQLEKQVFYYSGDLINVEIMSNVIVGKDAFRDTTIRELNISENCDLKSGAFAYISDLETANIADNVSIDDDAFKGSDPVIGTEVSVSGQSSAVETEINADTSKEDDDADSLESSETELADEKVESPAINDLSEAQSLQDICDFVKTEEKNLEEGQKTKTDEVLMLAASYGEYKNNKESFENYYSEMESEAQAFYDLVKESGIAYYKMLVNTIDINDYDSWDNAMDKFYDCFDGTFDDYYDTWDDLSDDIYNALDSILDDAYDTEDYLEVSDAWSEMYDNNLTNWNNMYTLWLDEWSLNYDIYIEIWSELYSGEIDVDAAVAKIEGENTEEDEDENTVEAETDDISSNEDISEEFKAAMDSYEEFFDDYVELTKKMADNSDDISIITEYADFMTKYVTTMSEFEAWDDKTMNDAEAAYYAEVSLRISQKLLEAAANY